MLIPESFRQSFIFGQMSGVRKAVLKKKEREAQK
jgi:hypothetical protein